MSLTAEGVSPSVVRRKATGAGAGGAAGVPGGTVGTWAVSDPAGGTGFRVSFDVAAGSGGSVIGFERSRSAVRAPGGRLFGPGTVPGAVGPREGSGVPGFRATPSTTATRKRTVRTTIFSSLP